MTEIKRWEVDFHGDEFTEHPEGDWVYWGDVEKFVTEMSKKLKEPAPLPPIEAQMSKFNVGDKVFHVGHGPGVIYAITETDYPIGVLYENGFASSFTKEGLYHGGHTVPQLLTLEEAKAKGYAVPVVFETD
jgi:hypothetical protein